MQITIEYHFKTETVCASHFDAFMQCGFDVWCSCHGHQGQCRGLFTLHLVFLGFVAERQRPQCKLAPYLEVLMLQPTRQKWGENCCRLLHCRLRSEITPPAPLLIGHTFYRVAANGRMSRNVKHATKIKHEKNCKVVSCWSFFFRR